jgi:predicted deacylase
LKQKKPLITTDVNFGAEGMQHGTLRIPHSHGAFACGYIPTPLWVAKGGVGPTVLLIGASRGDEYEGPVALMRLLHEGAFEKVDGRLIVIPSLNFPACRAGMRMLPMDRVELDHAFPGRRAGTATEMLAHYVETELLPLADYVLDMHSGGASLNYLPTLITYPAQSEEERRKLDLVVCGFNPPRELVMDPLSEDSVIGAGARRNGAVFVSGEFGGGASLSPSAVEIVVCGLKGALAALGVIPGDAAPASHAIQRLRVKPGEHYLHAPRSGVFEPLFVLGQDVKAGQLAGYLYDQEEPWREPEPLYFEGDGLVVCVRTFALAEAGDCLVHLAEALRA